MSIRLPGLTVLTAICSVSLTTMLAAQSPSARGDSLQAWIARSAVVVRSIDAADEDFTDLQPLIHAIGSARVVQLGEPGHGAGSAFAAKVRLVKFLHQRMGFDVLAWESGLFDVTLTQAGLRAQEDALTAARRGIFPIWSAAEEVRPLFEYARETQASANPLAMAGFDMQITAQGSARRFAAELREFAGALRDSSLGERASSLAARAIDSRERALEQLRKEDVEALARSAGELLALIRDRRATFAEVHGSRRISFMERAIDNMRAHVQNRFDSRQPGFRAVDGENRRDSLLATNLRWLLNEGYPGRKLIVWAHNAHVMNTYYASDFQGVHLDPAPERMKPSGVYLAEWLKDDVYTIGFTAYEGTDAMAGQGAPTTVAPAPDGTLEARLHALGRPFVFLDFRVLDGDIDHPLRGRWSMRVPKYLTNSLPDITKPFDAVFYIDRMDPATRVQPDAPDPDS